MLSSRWYKVFNDLWNNKTRTILIVLSIAVGLFAVGTIISARTILSTEMDKGFRAINPSSGTVRTLETFNEDFVQSVRAMPDVADADARRIISARVETNPGEWNNLIIFAIKDYDDMRINKVWHEEGAWPPPENEILIERAALQVIDAEIGDTIMIETADEKRRYMRVAGTVHDLAQMPAHLDNSPYGYISFETLDWLGEPYGFNELHIIARNGHNKEFAQRVVNEVKNKAEKAGYTIPLSLAAEPGQIPLDEILQAVLMLMGVLGVLSLFLSVFLIVNTISALLTQQRQQIGIMKAVGARTAQIMGMYLGMVLFYGIIALFIAIPPSIYGSRALSQFMAAMFNFDLTNADVPPLAVIVQVAIGLATPVLASLYPLISGLRVTAAEAMIDYGLGQGNFGTNIIDRALSGANLWFARRVLLRPILLSLRNTFRSKARLTLTLITLTLAGAIFVSVFSVRASLFGAIDALMQSWNFDTMIIFNHPYRIERIMQEAHNVPTVTATDYWIQLPIRHIRPDGSESGTIYLFAPRADSELSLPPAIAKGRWLLPEDDNAIVVNAIMAKDEHIELGDEITIKIWGEERQFRVVGVCLGILAPMSYGNYSYIARISGRAGQADAALIATEYQKAEEIRETTIALEAHFDRIGLQVANIQTMAAERAEADAVWGIIISLLLFMAILLAVVGGLGLMGTMSINVLERTREIGVLRAIGAPNRGVSQVFIREGVVIGVISWVFGCIFAVPLGKLLSDAVGIPMMGIPLDFSYSFNGAWLWLALVIILSATASFIPARNASRLTVREVLAYE